MGIATNKLKKMKYTLTSPNGQIIEKNDLESLTHHIQSPGKYVLTVRPVFQIGDVIRFDNPTGEKETCLLSQVTPQSLCAINLNNGDRQTDPISVQNIFDLSADELKQITNVDIEYIENLGQINKLIDLN